jgi:hypothetical protein
MIRGLLLFGLFLLTLRLAFLFSSPVVKNTMLEGKMEEIATNHGMKNETELRKDLLDFIHEKKIDLTSDQIYFEMNDQGICIAAHYTTEVSFWKYHRTYEFSPASSLAAREKARRQIRVNHAHV